MFTHEICFDYSFFLMTRHTVTMNSTYLKVNSKIIFSTYYIENKNRNLIGCGFGLYNLAFPKKLRGIKNILYI